MATQIVVDGLFNDKISSGVNNALNNVQRSSNSFRNILDTAFGVSLSGIFNSAVSGIMNVGKQMIDVTSNFEKYNAVLKNTFGSSSEASDSMQMLSEFAAQTPFSLDKITQSYVKLVNRGFKPTQEELRNLGDLASSSGKDIDQLVEALLDAQTLEFERLKEFGIKAKQSGDKVSLTFKGVTTTIDKSSESVKKYILSLGNATGVTGSMAAISKTLGGQISNLGDSWDQLLVAMGSKTTGTINNVISLFSKLINHIKDFYKESKSDIIKKQVSDLESYIAILKNTNINEDIRKKLIQDINNKYPELLKNIDLEKVSNQQLIKILQNSADAYRERSKAAFNQDAYTSMKNEKEATESNLALLAKQKQYLSEFARTGDKSFKDLYNSTIKWGDGLDSLWGDSTNDALNLVEAKIAENESILRQVNLSLKNSRQFNKIDYSKESLMERIAAVRERNKKESENEIIKNMTKGASTVTGAKLTDVTNLSTERNVKSLTINVDKLIGVNELKAIDIRNSESEIQYLVTNILKKLILDKSFAV